MIIEFAGLPGSGKSTAAEHVVRAATERGITVLTARDLSTPAHSFPIVPGLQHRLSLAWSVLKQPRMATILAWRLIKSPRNWFEKWYSFRHVIVTFTLLRRARRLTSPNTLTVLHEGACQRVFQAFVDAAGIADLRTVQRFLRDVPVSDIVVGLKVPPEVALARVRSRGYGALSDRFGELSDEELIGRFADGQGLLLQTIAHLEVRSTPRVCTLILDAHDLPQLLQRIDTHCIRTLLRHLNEASADAN